ncbi:putative tRNA (cytidine(34)-2'-O)-methyltransferase [Clostridia bacterium]|nr:putative tRNA (cytidine(34)-2'-O)-methyltransferase [Clostridia bacterium]
MNIILFQPEIPQNTGNISRTCAATGTALHLIEPLGFQINDARLKRAGLDYWQYLDWHVHRDFDAFLQAVHPKNVYAVSTHGGTRYTQVKFQNDDYLLFGRETAGLPNELLSRYPCLRIPMGEDIRSLNLSNAAALTLYEALRQLDFPNLK